MLGFLAVWALVGPFGLGLWAAELPWFGYFTFPSMEEVVSPRDLGELFLMFISTAWNKKRSLEAAAKFCSNRRRCP